jgi:hypothetical protein
MSGTPPRPGRTSATGEEGSGHSAPLPHFGRRLEPLGRALARGSPGGHGRPSADLGRPPLPGPVSRQSVDVGGGGVGSGCFVEDSGSGVSSTIGALAEPLGPVAEVRRRVDRLTILPCLGMLCCAAFRSLRRAAVEPNHGRPAKSRSVTRADLLSLPPLLRRAPRLSWASRRRRRARRRSGSPRRPRGRASRRPRARRWAAPAPAALAWGPPRRSSCGPRPGCSRSPCRRRRAHRCRRRRRPRPGRRHPTPA